MRALLFVLALLASALCAQSADAHALEPGYLEISPIEDGQWRVTWRKPQVQGQPMRINAQLPEFCTPREGPQARFDGRAFVSGWIATCDAPLAEGEVFIEGLAQTATDVLVRYTAGPEIAAQTFRLTPDTPSVVLPQEPTVWGIASSYFSLGVDHILSGLDHLLFVFALLLLITQVRPLVMAITAFTVAHSITLAAAALGWFTLPTRPVEAVIALSIVFLAIEILSRDEDRNTLMQRAPWTVAFAFGLLHGLGFASALREIGLPEGDVPLALVTFNLGVEAGQLIFVSVVLLAAGGLRLLAPHALSAQMRPGAPTATVVAYAIGMLATYWTVDRIAQIIV